LDEILIWGGGGEVLIDGIRTFANTISEGFGDADASVIAAGLRPEKPSKPVSRDRVTYIETPRDGHEV
jgi:hypothetical protein